MSIMLGAHIRILEARSRSHQKPFKDLRKRRGLLTTRVGTFFVRFNVATKHGKKNLQFVYTKGEDDVAISAHRLNLLSGSLDRWFINSGRGLQ